MTVTVQTVGTGVYEVNFQYKHVWCLRRSWPKPEPILSYVIAIQKYACDPPMWLGIAHIEWYEDDFYSRQVHNEYEQ